MALLDVFKKNKAEDRFKQKQKDKDKEKPEALSKASNFVAPMAGQAAPKEKSKIIVGPHIAEKSTFLNEKGVYVFKIKHGCNKVMIRQAIKKLYGVTPTKINIVNLPGKKVSVGGRRGIKPGFKKAMVYLKKGDKLEIV